MKEKSIKSRARASLKNKWPEAIGVIAIGLICLLLKTLLTQFLQYVFFADLASMATFILVLTALIDLFVFSPLYLGIIRWFWQITGGEDEPISSLFYYYENEQRFFLTIKLRVSFWWRIILAILICCVPSTAISIITSVFASVNGLSSVVTILGILSTVLSVAGIVAVLIYFIKYYLVIGIVLSDGSVSVNNAFRLSAALTKGKRASAFYRLILSFAGWGLISICILPIMYTLPFYMASYMIYSREKINEFVDKSTVTPLENQPLE